MREKEFLIKLSHRLDNQKNCVGKANKSSNKANKSLIFCTFIALLCVQRNEIFECYQSTRRSSFNVLQTGKLDAQFLEIKDPEVRSHTEEPDLDFGKFNKIFKDYEHNFEKV